MRVLSAIFVAIVAISTLAATAQTASADCYVSGYYTSRGTWVNGYHRTCPDGNPWNNYSTKGNYNPHTGRKGYIDPLKNSYRSRSTFDSYSSSDSYTPSHGGYGSYTPAPSYRSSYDSTTPSYRSRSNSGYRSSYDTYSPYRSSYDSYLPYRSSYDTYSPYRSQSSYRSSYSSPVYDFGASSSWDD